MSSDSYTSDDILVLDDRSHVRLRTSVYLGNMNTIQGHIPDYTKQSYTIPIAFVPAAYRALCEIIDNAIDEFSHMPSGVKELRIQSDVASNTFVVSDTGRGVPIDKHVTGKHTPEVVFGSLRSGRNFVEDRGLGVIGQNGVGSSVTNFCSKSFEVLIHRGGKQYYQKFEDGAATASVPTIHSVKKAPTGTQIKFQLDPAIFPIGSIPPELVMSKAHELAALHPEITVFYNNSKIVMNNGINEFIHSTESAYSFNISSDRVKGTILVVLGEMDDTISPEARCLTWVNSSFLFDGGKCNTQLFNSLYEHIIDSNNKLLSKSGVDLTKNDIRNSMRILCSLHIHNPEYDSQSKLKLTGPDLRKDFDSIIVTHEKAFNKHSKSWIADIIELVQSRNNIISTKKAQQKQERKSRHIIDTLLDATNTNRMTCILFITEGLSAKSSISEARDPKTMAVIPLTGKINNVYGLSPHQLLEISAVTDLITTIGLVPGKKAIRSMLSYGSIAISTDADYDGGDIFCLLTNLFYQFWPELLDPTQPPFIHRLIVPNVVVSKGRKRIHFSDREQFEANKHKHVNWTVEYMKGLGSMSMPDWNVILGDVKKYLIPIVDDGKLGEALFLLFGAEPEIRRTWLSNPAQEML